MTEARFCAKLADPFDWMTIDARRNKHSPTLREGDKYILGRAWAGAPQQSWDSVSLRKPAYGQLWR
jgi:hypothetical protein